MMLFIQKIKAVSLRERIILCSIWTVLMVIIHILTEEKETLSYLFWASICWWSSCCLSLRPCRGCSVLWGGVPASLYGTSSGIPASLRVSNRLPRPVSVKYIIFWALFAVKVKTAFTQRWQGFLPDLSEFWHFRALIGFYAYPHGG